MEVDFCPKENLLSANAPDVSVKFLRNLLLSTIDFQ
jgi:hypothetical protein